MILALLDSTGTPVARVARLVQLIANEQRHTLAALVGTPDRDGNPITRKFSDKDRADLQRLLVALDKARDRRVIGLLMRGDHPARDVLHAGALDRARMMVGTGAAALGDAIALTRHAAELGFAGALGLLILNKSFDFAKLWVIPHPSVLINHAYQT